MGFCLRLHRQILSSATELHRIRTGSPLSPCANKFSNFNSLRRQQSFPEFSVSHLLIALTEKLLLSRMLFLTLQLKSGKAKARKNPHFTLLPSGVQIALVNIFDRLLGANYGDRRKSQQTERVTHNNSRSGSRTLSRINTRMYKYTHIGGWASSSNAPGLSGSQHRIHVGQEPPV